MKFKKDNALVKIANQLGRIISFFTVILWLLTLINSALMPMIGFHFLGDATGILEYIKYWATLVAVALSGMEFAFKRFFTAIIYLIVVAGCVILMCFPGTFETLAHMVIGG